MHAQISIAYKAYNLIYESESCLWCYQLLSQSSKTRNLWNPRVHYRFYNILESD